MTARITEYDKNQSENLTTKQSHSNQHSASAKITPFCRPGHTGQQKQDGRFGQPGQPGTKPEDKKRRLAARTKYFLDFMFYGAILVTLSLPLSIHWTGRYLAGVEERYWALLAVYVILGFLAVVLLGELRKIFRTVLAENCFVQENVGSLHRMGSISSFIVVMSMVRIIIYPSLAMGVVIFVFIIAGLCSKVLAYVFEEAVRYKEENDMTI